MENFVCPYCEKNYPLQDGSIEVGAKFFCKSCGKKAIIMENGESAIFAFDAAAGEENLITACPFCFSKYEFPSDTKGLFLCSECEKTFFVSESMPQLPQMDNEPAYADISTAKTEENVPAEKHLETEKVESVGNDRNPLLLFANDAKNMLSDISTTIPLQNVKVGISREKSGVFGIFINIAEKLCGR